MPDPIFDPGDVLAALAEPTRLRIVRLLHRAPRAVGEIATEIGARQPQVTKHLRTLEDAGLTTMQALGQRRIYSLRREPLAALRDWLEPLREPDASRAARRPHEAAVEQEREPAAHGGERGCDLQFERFVAAPAERVWAAWTSAPLLRRWFAPRHFTVAHAVVEPVPGGLFAVVFAEGDGTRHTASGSVVLAHPPHALVFELAPRDERGAELFTARYALTLNAAGAGHRQGRRPGTGAHTPGPPRPAGTRLVLRVRVDDVRDAAVPTPAGMEPGWNETLDALVTLLRKDVP